MHGFHGFMRFPFHVGGIVLLLLVIGLVWWVVKERSRSGQPGADANDSLDIVQRRFAAGEIDEAEYNRLKDVLSR